MGEMNEPTINLPSQPHLPKKELMETTGLWPPSDQEQPFCISPLTSTQFIIPYKPAVIAFREGSIPRMHMELKGAGGH